MFAGKILELIASSDPYRIMGYLHGGDDTFDLDFSTNGDSAAIKLINPSGREERHVRRAQQRLPVIMRTSVAALQLTLRHPSSQPLMSGTMRRFQTTDAAGAERQGMISISPISFENTAYAVADTSCGTLGALSVQADGIPVAHVEHTSGEAREQLGELDIELCEIYDGYEVIVDKRKIGEAFLTKMTPLSC